jgi:hypothetical protein
MNGGGDLSNCVCSTNRHADGHPIYYFCTAQNVSAMERLSRYEVLFCTLTICTWNTSQGTRPIDWLAEYIPRVRTMIWFLTWIVDWKVHIKVICQPNREDHYYSHKGPPLNSALKQYIPFRTHPHLVSMSRSWSYNLTPYMSSWHNA